jgi:adenylate kinase
VRLIFLGPPGAGKGTQANVLAETCKVPHISTGDILRGAVASSTDLGMKAKGYMDRGELVPDDLILNMVGNRLDEEDTRLGWILDGFPRNVSQAKFLDVLLEQISQQYDCVVNLDVSDEVIVSRLLDRGRDDDNESVIRTRLSVYREQTAPLINFYRDRQMLVSVDGNQPVEDVTACLSKVIIY